MLRADAGAYRALVRRRWGAALTAALICFALAAVIVYLEYRLALIALVVAFPAAVPFIEAVFVSRWAREAGAAEVRFEGELLRLRSEVAVEVGKITLVRVQPDALFLNEKWGRGPKQVRVHLLPAVEGAPELLARLEGRGVKVLREKATVLTVAGFVWGVVANMLLEVVAGVLVLGALVYGGKAAFTDQGGGWEAAGCLGGALVALTARALIVHFLPRADPKVRG